MLIGVALTTLVSATARLEDALPLLRDAEAHLRSAGAYERLVASLSTTAFAALAEGIFDDADRLNADALEATASVENPFMLALIHGNRGLAALLQGRYEEAARALRDELSIAHADALITYYFEGLPGFAALAAFRGEDERAAALEAAAWDHNDRAIWIVEQPVYDRLDERFLAPARERLGRDGWARASQAGRGLTAEAAIALTHGLEPAAPALSNLPVPRAL